MSLTTSTPGPWPGSRRTFPGRGRTTRRTSRHAKRRSRRGSTAGSGAESGFVGWRGVELLEQPLAQRLALDEDVADITSVSSCDLELQFGQVVVQQPA